MNDKLSDQGLVRDFAETRSERAFALLVERHMDLVFATAMRSLGEQAAAQQVAQDVFIELARKKRMAQ